MASQDEMIARLNRDKKGMDESSKQLNEKLQAEEDKVNHLNKLKQKLESTLDEVGFCIVQKLTSGKSTKTLLLTEVDILLLFYQLEDNLEREKKVRGDVEKAKRKLEQDLKSTQGSVEDLERIKRELEEANRK